MRGIRGTSVRGPFDEDPTLQGIAEILSLLLCRVGGLAHDEAGRKCEVHSGEARNFS